MIILTIIVTMCACMLSHFSYVWLFATPWTSLPGSSIHGLFQARILEWVVISFPGIHPNPRIEPSLPHCRKTLYHLSHQRNILLCNLVLDFLTKVFLKSYMEISHLHLIRNFFGFYYYCSLLHTVPNRMFGSNIGSSFLPIVLPRKN